MSCETILSYRCVRHLMPGDFGLGVVPGLFRSQLGCGASGVIRYFPRRTCGIPAEFRSHEGGCAVGGTQLPHPAVFALGALVLLRRRR
jgi:MYXO-CTERM domain-containing protein